jgi:mannosyl-3-phosphoglycerate phosphatase
VLRLATEHGVEVVFCSSKTRPEIEALLAHLGLTVPYIAENGGVVCIPDGYFERGLPELPSDGAYRVAALGVPHAALASALAEIGEEAGVSLRGFSEMDSEEIAALTGLDEKQAQLAARREFDEPFATGEMVPENELRLAAAAARRGLRVVTGGRFRHLTGPSDKGAAIRWLGRLFRNESGTLWSAGIGDSANDIPMLSVVDYAVLVQRPGGRYDPSVLRAVPRIRLARGVGPAGWARAVMGILRGIPA